MTYRLMFISHGDFAAGVKNALEMIIGKQDFIETYGLQIGQNPNEIFENISETINSNEDIIILSDLIGGSMHNAAVGLLDRENVVLIGGINLSIAMQVALTKPTSYEIIDEQIEESKNAFQRIILKEDFEDSFF